MAHNAALSVVREVRCFQRVVDEEVEVAEGTIPREDEKSCCKAAADAHFLLMLLHIGGVIFYRDEKESGAGASIESAVIPKIDSLEA